MDWMVKSVMLSRTNGKVSMNASCIRPLTDKLITTLGLLASTLLHSKALCLRDALRLMNVKKTLSSSQLILDTQTLLTMEVLLVSLKMVMLFMAPTMTTAISGLALIVMHVMADSSLMALTPMLLQRNIPTLLAAGVLVLVRDTFTPVLLELVVSRNLTLLCLQEQLLLCLQFLPLHFSEINYVSLYYLIHISHLMVPANGKPTCNLEQHDAHATLRIIYFNIWASAALIGK